MKRRDSKQLHHIRLGIRCLAKVRPDLDPLVLGEDLTEIYEIKLHKAIKNYKAEIQG